MSAPKDDETKFNETLKRMLESPPKPHESSKAKKKQEAPPKRGPKASRED